MADGFSASAWLRFDSLDHDQLLYWIALSHQTDVTFFTPFAGPHNGYIASATPSPSVSTLGAGALEWHHYCATLDLHSGEVVTYIDGAELARETFASTRGFSASFFASKPTLQFGARCTSASLAAAVSSATCDLTPNGVTSFVGIFRALLGRRRSDRFWFDVRIGSGLRTGFGFGFALAFALRRGRSRFHAFFLS